MKDRPIKHMIGPDSTPQMCDWSSGKSIISDITVLQKSVLTTPTMVWLCVLVKTRPWTRPLPQYDAGVKTLS